MLEWAAKLEKPAVFDKITKKTFYKSVIKIETGRFLGELLLNLDTDPLLVKN